MPSLPLFAGGKSFGGRMTSQSHAETPLPRVQGLIFLGFPFHPAARHFDAWRRDGRLDYRPPLPEASAPTLAANGAIH